MQNKANSRNDKMNGTLFAAKDYENETAFKLRKYKPNQTQFHRLKKAWESCTFERPLQTRRFSV